MGELCFFTKQKIFFGEQNIFSLYAEIVQLVYTSNRFIVICVSRSDCHPVFHTMEFSNSGVNVAVTLTQNQYYWPVHGWVHHDNNLTLHNFTTFLIA